MNKKKILEIIPPKHQLKLYGYKKYFDSFIKLLKNKKLPNTILLSGVKGSGKSTFAYHFINYLLSVNEEKKYSLTDFTINPDNKSYKNVCNLTHPNFVLLNNTGFEENIKIDKVRDILRFLKKTSYKSNIKIVLIDNLEYLNISSANSLLKSLEEPSSNTFFFLIHNTASKMLNTIKSRCIEFKFFFNIDEKKNILKNISNQIAIDLFTKEISNNLYFDSPGNLLRYQLLYYEDSFKTFDNKISCISFLVEKYKQKKDPQLLSYISRLIELYYNELSIKNIQNVNFHFFNRFKILKEINDAKKFNLDKNNLFISFQDLIKNES